MELANKEYTQLHEGFIISKYKKKGCYFNGISSLDKCECSSNSRHFKIASKIVTIPTATTNRFAYVLFRCSRFFKHTKSTPAKQHTTDKSPHARATSSCVAAKMFSSRNEQSGQFYSVWTTISPTTASENVLLLKISKQNDILYETDCTKVWSFL